MPNEEKAVILKAIYEDAIKNLTPEDYAAVRQRVIDYAIQQYKATFTTQPQQGV